MSRPERGGRSHPPSLLRLAERLLRDEHLVRRGDLVLCACSGGPDSTALLHVLAILRSRLGHQVAAVGVDHGLREAAASELSLAADLAASLEVPFTVARVSVAQGGNLQARARAARFGALREAASVAGAACIATGHTADDRAETFLLRLLRGAGPRGLAVLPPRAPFPAILLGAEETAERDLDGELSEPSEIAGPPLIRPLLRARRADILEHLRRHKIPFAEDPSNLDPRFTRVRVRRELIPLLEDLSPRIVEHITFLAEALAEAGTPPEDGGEVLGRDQRRLIERARRLGRTSVKVRVRDGRDVEATFPDGKVVLIDTRARRPA